MGYSKRRTSNDGSYKCDGIPMDSLITAAARALAAGDPLGALKRVALRDDPPALALRGIAHGTARRACAGAVRGGRSRSQIFTKARPEAVLRAGASGADPNPKATASAGRNRCFGECARWLGEHTTVQATHRVTADGGRQGRGAARPRPSSVPTKALGPPSGKSRPWGHHRPPEPALRSRPPPQRRFASRGDRSCPSPCSPD